jgi:hypothetical protein
VEEEVLVPDPVSELVDVPEDVAVLELVLLLVSDEVLVWEDVDVALDVAVAEEVSELVGGRWWVEMCGEQERSWGRGLESSARVQSSTQKAR